MRAKVLVIEDSPTEAAIMRSLVTEEEIDVEVASSGREGIAKALAMRPDLIVLDLILPDISGFEVCSRLNQEEALAQTIVIICSSKGDPQDIHKAFSCGADDYMIKPSVFGFLVKKIKLYLGLRQERDE